MLAPTCSSARTATPADRVDRAIARLTLAADAGADSLYPVGRHDDATMRRLTSELPLPVNAIAIPEQ